MKKYVSEILKRGLMAAAGGPIVLAIVYAILGVTGVVEALTPKEVSLGILTVSLLAFIVAGSSIVYQIERLSLFTAALVQGVTLYLDYILIYLLNGWLQHQWHAIAIFTAVFVLGYAVIWLIIYCVTKASTSKINRKLTSQ